jgi:glycosyltransferase involved in cell wall biosynthesis
MDFKDQVIHFVCTRIKEGGGKILLDCLMSNTHNNNIVFYLDESLKKNSSHFSTKEIKIVWVPENIISRTLNDFRLYRTLNNDSKIIFFNGVPPLFSFLHIKSFIFFQNALLVGKLNASDLHPCKYREAIKKLYIRLFIGNVSFYVVQTASMKNSLLKISGPKNIYILPFLPLTITNPQPTIPNDGGFKYDLIYPATGYQHKNHQNLIDALKILSREGIFPTVILTFDPTKFRKLNNQIEYAKRESGLRVINCGFIAREDLFLLMNKTKALVYPSLCESFGLPLHEANSMNMPIIASELDYVRDSCDPVETFDPNSPLSIARAIKRFLLKNNVKNQNIEMMGPLDFIKALSDKRFK